LTNDRLQEALAIQAQRGGKIGSILASLNYVDKDDVGNALSEQLGVPYVDLRKETFLTVY